MKDSHIQWTDNTFNPWEGCTKVSPGCANCYAEARNQRFSGGANWGKGAPRRRTVPSNWREPVKWNAASEKASKAWDALQGSRLRTDADPTEYHRPRVFCASLADWLDDEVPAEWLADLLDLVRTCDFLVWQLLTKRPQNWRPRLIQAMKHVENHPAEYPDPDALHAWILDWASVLKPVVPPANVWVGTTVEDQTRAEERIPLLLAIPAAVRFLSCEPLLGRIEFSNVTKRTDCVAQLGKPALDGIQWVIVGGESGHGARVTCLGALESVIHQCRAVGVPVFVKQLGAKPQHDFVGYPGSHIDRGLHLRHPKGGDLAEWPERFQVQQFPNEEAAT